MFWRKIKKRASPITGRIISSTTEVSIIVIPILQMRKPGTERQCDLPQVTQLLSG